jgi:putative transposase
MSRTRYRFGDNRQPHFLTCTVVAWLPVFTRPEAVSVWAPDGSSSVSRG